MWSYAVVLWELSTREVPFADLSPMEIGMKARSEFQCSFHHITYGNLFHQVALENLRISVPTGISAHMSRLIKICMNEDPAKRPRFDMVIPILEKMKANG